MASSLIRLLIPALLAGAAAGQTSPPGAAPNWVISYQLQQDGNAVALGESGTLTFPPTAIDSPVSATVVIANRGNATGTVSSLSLGAPFQLLNVPLLPAAVESGRDFRVTVRFQPVKAGSAKDQLVLTLGSIVKTFPVEGIGLAPSLRYRITDGDVSAAVQPTQTISFRDTAVGSRRSILLEVQNAGNSDARLTGLTLTGESYKLNEAPTLPLTLAPAKTAVIEIVFAPARPERSTGRLRVGDDSFDLTGIGLGSLLTFAVTSGAVETPLSSSGTITMPATQLGQPSSVKLSIGNSGTSAGVVNSISIAGSSAAFSLPDLPSFPVQIPPGGAIAIRLVFTPSATGSHNSTLLVDSIAFPLLGFASQPPPLPSYTWDRPSGEVNPLDQIAVGLRISEAYPLPITGTLVLSFNSEVFASDPALQFATGSRSVNFTIPANTTRALFANNAAQIRLQTGTVAGTIMLTPTFATLGVNLTPPAPPALSLTIPKSPPRLLQVDLASPNATTITVGLTGYATGRSIRQIEFEFVPNSSTRAQVTRFVVNSESAFTSWYQSSGSQAYGSIFTASIPFTIQGGPAGATSAATLLESIAVSLVNQDGTSETVRQRFP